MNNQIGGNPYQQNPINSNYNSANIMINLGENPYNPHFNQTTGNFNPQYQQVNNQQNQIYSENLNDYYYKNKPRSTTITSTSQQHNNFAFQDMNFRVQGQRNSEFNRQHSNLEQNNKRPNFISNTMNAQHFQAQNVLVQQKPPQGNYYPNPKFKPNRITNSVQNSSFQNSQPPESEDIETIKNQKLFQFNESKKNNGFAQSQHNFIFQTNQKNDLVRNSIGAIKQPFESSEEKNHQLEYEDDEEKTQIGTNHSMFLKTDQSDSILNQLEKFLSENQGNEKILKEKITLEKYPLCHKFFIRDINKDKNNDEHTNPEHKKLLNHNDNKKKFIEHIGKVQFVPEKIDDRYQDRIIKLISEREKLECQELVIPLENYGYYATKSMGKGAFSCVFEICHYKSPEIKFAAKIIKDKNGDHEKYFQREIWANKCLSLSESPYVVKMQRVLNLSNDTVALILEIGETNLTKYLEINPPQTEEEIFRIFYQIVQGVKIMHYNNLVHRDLKPDNILVFKRGGQFLFKICDFTLSKIVFEGNNDYTYVGSRGFMPPEIENLDEVPDSYLKLFDTYSLGQILQYLIGKEGEMMEKKKEISKELELLIKNLTNPTVEKRFTIDNILASDWFRKHSA